MNEWRLSQAIWELFFGSLDYPLNLWINNLLWNASLYNGICMQQANGFVNLFLSKCFCCRSFVFVKETLILMPVSAASDASPSYTSRLGGNRNTNTVFKKTFNQIGQLYIYFYKDIFPHIYIYTLYIIKLSVVKVNIMFCPTVCVYHNPEILDLAIIWSFLLPDKNSLLSHSHISLWRCYS